MAYTLRNLAKQALRDIGAIDPVDPVENEDLDTVMQAVALLSDSSQADRMLLFTAQRVSFVFTPNQQVDTLGPGGTFNTTPTFGATAPRPQWLGLSSVTPAGDVLDYPLTPYHDRAAYDAEPWKTVTDLFPRRFLYEPGWPLGSLTWWPIPTTNATANLRLPVPLTGMPTPDTVLSFPPGYLEVFLYRLELRLCVPYRKKLTAEQVQIGKQAEGIVKRNNDPGPPIAQGDGAFSSHRGGSYNIYTNRTKGTE